MVEYRDLVGGAEVYRGPDRARGNEAIEHAIRARLETAAPDVPILIERISYDASAKSLRISHTRWTEEITGGGGRCTRPLDSVEYEHPIEIIRAMPGIGPGLPEEG